MTDALATLTGGLRTKEQLNRLVREGKVSRVLADGRVRVQFDDQDGVDSNPLAVLQRWRGSQDFPVVGEPVVCLMLPPDQIDGYVLGGKYDKTQAPPDSDPKVRIQAGDQIRQGSKDAAHPAPLGDVLLRILVGLREMLASVQVATPAGPGQLTGSTTDYGSGPFAAIAAQMAADIDDAVLNSQKITLE